MLASEKTEAGDPGKQAARLSLISPNLYNPNPPSNASTSAMTAA
jgi:hypothetical protein